MSGIEIAKKWFNAFNEHSITDLLSLYADDAEHFSPRLKNMHPETNGLIKGKAAMFDWWHNAFERIPTLKYTIVELREVDDTVFMTYIRSAQGEADLTVNESLKIRDGKIVFSKVIVS